MRLTTNDVELLCSDFMERNLKGKCLGCRLNEELKKSVAQRSKSLITRVSPRVIKLRAQDKRTRSVT